MNRADEIIEAYKRDCEEIADQCAEEGYPSHGSNYELRCEQLWNDYYKEEYDAL